MSRDTYFSYVRVSSVRQGLTNTSLTEQRSAIEQYARTWNLTITREFEEQETAAKHGRPVFLSMVNALKLGKAKGVIVHKIDRSARNLRDWAELGTLIDRGAEVHFANEGLDLHSRGGRLSADIQAVVASDYIRNLREEAKKGIYGRLKQGLFPFRAIVGYLDAGGGKPKKTDPVQAPFIKKLFELYSSGDWSLNALVEEMYEVGLRSRNGRKVNSNGLSHILHNPFYMGVVRIKTMDEVFLGQHEPIISKQLFDRVQTVLARKHVKKKRRHFFIFSRHILCARCRRNLIAERQKGHVYYRCQTKACQQKTIREETIEEQFGRVLGKLRFNEKENRFFRQAVEAQNLEVLTMNEKQKQELEYRLSMVREKGSRLADAYMENVFDKETYAQKKSDLVFEEKEIRIRLDEIRNDPEQSFRRLEEFLELANSAYQSYKQAISTEKRELVKVLTSNIIANGKSVSIKLNLPFQIVYEREVVGNGGAYGVTSRTLSALVSQLVDYFCKNEETHSVEGTS